MALITINKKNFYHNLNQIAIKVGSIEKIAIVLKDNAYGHGLEIMAQLSSEFGIRHSVVRNHSEAKKIKSLFETTLILGGEIIPLEGCFYAINSIDNIASIPTQTQVELKVDTGMHRNGIMMSQIEEALEKIKKHKLKLVGVMTHYRSADELSSELFWQSKQFDEVCRRVEEAGFEDIRIHSCNSASALRLGVRDEDIVRIGISAYGYSQLHYPFDFIDLKPVLTLYASRVSSRLVQAGERIGYGGSFTASKEMSISTYDLGYGDGWCRGDSAKSYITSEGLPMLGRVSMDLISLESVADEVCIMNNAQDTAKQFGTISYEVITALSVEITREIV